MASDVTNVSTRVLQCGIEADLPEKHDLSIAILGARVHDEGTHNTDFDKADELFFGSARELSSCLSGKMTPVTADEGDRGSPRDHVSPRRSPRNCRSKSDRVPKMTEVTSNGVNSNPTVKSVPGLCNGHGDERPRQALMEDAKIGLSPRSDLKLNGTSPSCATQCNANGIMSLQSAGSPAQLLGSSSCGKKCHVADSSHGNRTPCSNGIASSVVRAIRFEEDDVRREEFREGKDTVLVTSTNDVITGNLNLEESPQAETTNIPNQESKRGEVNTSDISHETDRQEAGNKRKGKKRSSEDGVIPMVPRKRRMASITAELKVNLMYEKDDWKPPKKTRKGKSLSSSSSDGEVFTTSPTDSSKQDLFANGDMNGGYPSEQDQPLDLSMKKRPIVVAVKKVKSKTKPPGTAKKQKSRSKSFPPQSSTSGANLCGHTKRMAALNAQAIMTAYKATEDASQTKKGNRGKSKSTGGPTKNGYKGHPHAANFRLLCASHRGFNKNGASLMTSSGLPTLQAQPPGIVSPVPSHPQTLMLTGLASLSASQILPNGGISPTTDSAFSTFSSARLHNGVWYQTAGPFRPLHTVLSAQADPSTDSRARVSPALETAQTHNYRVAAKTKRKKSTNGWKWQGEPYEKMVFSATLGKPVRRLCYRGMCRQDDLVRERDTVLLKSGPRKKDLPFVAKVTALWENPEDGEMMMSLLWYYRPEHIEGGKRPQHGESELFAARHPDENSVACIEDKCYVLTYSEFCRFRRQLKVREEATCSLNSLVPLDEVDFTTFLPPHRRLPDNVDPESVYFCRRVYDFRHGRMLKNPI